MPMISDTALTFAREQFCAQIAELLDDPWLLFEPDCDLSPTQELIRLRHLAGDLGLDFDALLAKGSARQQQRLEDIFQGKHARYLKPPIGDANDQTAISR